MPRKPFFSEEDVKRAMDVDTIAFIERYYGYSFKQVGRDYRCKEHNSLVVRSDRKRWYWNSRNAGGENVLSFLQKIERLSFYEAVKAVVNEPMLPIRPEPSDKSAIAKPSVVAEAILPPAVKGKYARAFAYLNKSRGIDPSIINYLMKEGKLYQEDKTGNAVFVNYDKNKKATFYTKQGTNTQHRFKGNAELPKDDKENVNYYFENYGFWQEGFDKTIVYVFEAPIDLLSHATLANMYKGKNTYWLQHSRIALCGVSELALDQFLEQHPAIREIRLGFDNDNAGRIATSKFIDKYSEMGYLVKDVSPQKDKNFDGKDYNDKLLHERQNNPAFFQIKSQRNRGVR